MKEAPPVAMESISSNVILPSGGGSHCCQLPVWQKTNKYLAPQQKHCPHQKTAVTELFWRITNKKLSLWFGGYVTSCLSRGVNSGEGVSNRRCHQDYLPLSDIHISSRIQLDDAFIQMCFARLPWIQEFHTPGNQHHLTMSSLSLASE